MSGLSAHAMLAPRESSNVTFDDSGRPSHLYGDTGPGTTLVLVSGIGIILCFPLLLNRFIWRVRLARVGLDDIFTLFAWLCLFALGLVSYKAVDYGYGRKSSSLTREEASNALRLFYVYQILYKTSINLSKLSILFIYLRVFGPATRRSWFFMLTYTLIVFIGAYLIASITVTIFECTPIDANWDTSKDFEEKPHKCISTLAFWYANAIYNIVTEVLILLSAIIRIWSLSPAPTSDHSYQSATAASRRSPLTQKDKYSLSFVFALGFFTVATAILRMTTLKKTDSQDRSHGTLISTIWSTVEASCAILCANLPMLRIVFREISIRWKRGFCCDDKENLDGPETRYINARRNEMSHIQNLSSPLPPCSPPLTTPATSPTVSTSAQSEHTARAGAAADLKGEVQRLPEYIARPHAAQTAHGRSISLPLSAVSSNNIMFNKNSDFTHYFAQHQRAVAQMRLNEQAKA